MLAWNKLKPFLAVIFIQISYALMSIVAKFALNAGMSPHVLVAYRMAVAAALLSPLALILERNTRPKITFKLLLQISILSFFEPVIEQNLFYTGMKMTTATFTSALCNVLPAMTFIMACIFRLEKVNIRKRHSQAKLLGTVFAVGGAMIMTFMKGNVIQLPWSNVKLFGAQPHATSEPKHEDVGIKGAAMLIASCFSWSCYIIFQAKIMRSHPAQQLSMTALMCLTGMLEAAVVALIWERNNTSVWVIHPDVRLIAILYGGIVSGLAYYIIGWVAKERGPVFVSAFNPLNMVIIAVLSSFVFSEVMYLGRVIGAAVIVLGIYLVLWGKSQDLKRQQSSKIEATEMVIKMDEERPNLGDSYKGRVVVPRSADQLAFNVAVVSQDSV